MEQHVEGLLFWESCIPRNSPTSLVYACGFVCVRDPNSKLPPVRRVVLRTSNLPKTHTRPPPTPTPLQIPQDKNPIFLIKRRA